MGGRKWWVLVGNRWKVNMLKPVMDLQPAGVVTTFLDTLDLTLTLYRKVIYFFSWVDWHAWWRPSISQMTSSCRPPTTRPARWRHLRVLWLFLSLFWSLARFIEWSSKMIVALPVTDWSLDAQALFESTVNCTNCLHFHHTTACRNHFLQLFMVKWRHVQTTYRSVRSHCRNS